MKEDKIEKSEQIQEHIHDIATLPRMVLNAKYQTTYNSWRNRKAIAKREGNWSPEFEEFPDFLRVMGPLSPGQTLDRIDPSNPLYAPDLVKWANKREQANNRRNTLRVKHRGAATPLTEAADGEGISPEAYRQRLRRLTAEQAFEAFLWSVSEDERYDPRRYRPWPRHKDKLAEGWERIWLEAGGIRRAGTRYDFLHRAIRKIWREADSRLYEMYNSGVSEADLNYKSDQELSTRCKETIARIEYERPIWLEAANKFEAREQAKTDERTFLKQGYLKPSSDDFGDE